MQTIAYDGTFAGFLSAVFDIYEYKFRDIAFSGTAASLFAPPHRADTSEAKALRVWKGLDKYISSGALHDLHAAFLSEITGMEDVLYRYIRYVFDSRQSVEKDYSHEAVLQVSQTAKKVYRERHRMEAFVRFKLTGDGLYYAIVEPDFNVLPLLIPHFQQRYADQRWMIYDIRRKYGIYYDLTRVTIVELEFGDGVLSGSAKGSIHDEKEGLYQALWKTYFTSVNIPARKNMKLHIRHMPYRYWRYLSEKQ